MFNLLKKVTDDTKALPSLVLAHFHHPLDHTVLHRVPEIVHKKCSVSSSRYHLAVEEDWKYESCADVHVPTVAQLTPNAVNLHKSSFIKCHTQGNTDVLHISMVVVQL